MIKSRSAKSEMRPWVVISAYDLSVGASSEGHVAFNILREICKEYRIILITRRNNKTALEENDRFRTEYPGMHLIGYDLPKWASWWKRGARFYQPYAYLWQLTWPLIFKKHPLIRRSLKLVHVLNFHNDSIPSLAWKIGVPVVWGPINHHEVVAPWRREFWPKGIAFKHAFIFSFRRILWRCDPLLRIHIRKSDVILSAGIWVDNRLKFKKSSNIISQSQLGVDEKDFYVQSSPASSTRSANKQLICAGRLDWIKGIDLAIEALALLPEEYTLKIIGKGPADLRLRALVKKHQLEDRVIFQPPVPRSELTEIYRNSNLFLFPSAEVAGLVWVEALANGLPVVAFDGETELVAASKDLPGLYLAPATTTRQVQIKGFAAMIEEASNTQYSASEISNACLQKYKWVSVSTTIKYVYNQICDTAQ